MTNAETARETARSRIHVTKPGIACATLPDALWTPDKGRSTRGGSGNSAMIAPILRYLSRKGRREGRRGEIEIGFPSLTGATIRVTMCRAWELRTCENAA